MREISVYTTFAIVCGVSLAVLAGAEPLGSNDQMVLDSGTLILRRLSLGEEHRYQLPLASGEFARVVVEQQGIDVVVGVRDADDVEIDEFQDELGSAAKKTWTSLRGKRGRTR